MTVTSPQYAIRDCHFSAFYYEAIQINVFQSGVYTLSTISDLDTHGSIYTRYFNPYRPFERLLFSADTGCYSAQFKITTELQFGITYVLVVTTISPQAEGVGSSLILVSGPNNVTFSRISKSNI